jgi:hypothetical protein
MRKRVENNGAIWLLFSPTASVWPYLQSPKVAKHSWRAFLGQMRTYPDLSIQPYLAGAEFREMRCSYWYPPSRAATLPE